MHLVLYLANVVFEWDGEADPLVAGDQQGVQALQYGEFYLALGSIQFNGIVRIFGFNLETPEEYIVTNEFALQFWEHLVQFNV